MSKYAIFAHVFSLLTLNEDEINRLSLDAYPLIQNRGYGSKLKRLIYSSFKVHSDQLYASK